MRGQVFFRPMGGTFNTTARCTHGLRRGLHSIANLTACA